MAFIYVKETELHLNYGQYNNRAMQHDAMFE